MELNTAISNHLGIFSQNQYILLSQQLFPGQLQKAQHQQTTDTQTSTLHAYQNELITLTLRTNKLQHHTSWSVWDPCAVIALNSLSLILSPLLFPRTLQRFAWTCGMSATVWGYLVECTTVYQVPTFHININDIFHNPCVMAMRKKTLSGGCYVYVLSNSVRPKFNKKE